MNSPVRWRKFEADCHRTNDLGDRKRANEFGSEFITDGAERNVLRRKPHFLTNDVYGRLRPVAIGLSLSARSRSGGESHGLFSKCDGTSGRRRGQRGPQLRIPD